MPGLGDLEKLFMRALAALPPLLVGLAVILSLAVLLGVLPAAPFLAVAILLLSAGMFMLSARQARLEELLHDGLGYPRRLLDGLDKRLRTLERRVEELIRRSPDMASSGEEALTTRSAPAPAPQPRQAAGRSAIAGHGATAQNGAVSDRRKKRIAPESPAAWEGPSAATTERREPRTDSTGRPPSGPTAVPGRDVPRSLPGGPLAAPARQLLESFRLYMEPVIDRFASRTVLYRAVPGLVVPAGAPDTEGRLCLGTDAHLQAARHGVARALDRQLLQAARAFAAQMHRRQSRLPVVVPLSYDFLMAPDAREQLEDLLSDSAANSLPAVEIPQQAMAALGERAVRLIAWLAERGVRMSLGQADPCHMDARALSALGFVWCDVPYHALRQAQEQECAIPVLPQVVAAGLHGKADLETLPPVCRLVRGRAFAPPRRVRDEVFRPADPSRAAA